MEFGFINLMGAVIVLLLLIPNVIHALRTGGQAAAASVPKALLIAEQIGRYGCLVLMWLPLFVWKFGFGSAAALLAYVFLNGALLIAYYFVWAAYARKKTLGRAMTLAVLPAAMFLLSGLLLRHWCLAAFAVLFGAAHGAVTYLTHQDSGR